MYSSLLVSTEVKTQESIHTKWAQRPNTTWVRKPAPQSLYIVNARHRSLWSMVNNYSSQDPLGICQDFFEQWISNSLYSLRLQWWFPAPLTLTRARLGAPCGASWPERCCWGNLKMRSCRSPAAWAHGELVTGRYCKIRFPGKVRGVHHIPSSKFRTGDPLQHTSTLWVSPSFPISMTSSPWHLALLLGTGLLSKRLNFRRQSSMSSALASWFIASFGGFQSLYRGTPQIIHFNRMFHYKPSSYWGTPHFRKPPSCDLQTWMVEWLFSQWRARF